VGMARMLVFVICGIIKSVIPNSYVILQGTCYSMLRTTYLVISDFVQEFEVRYCQET
jgi:hypothetical protein